MGDESTDISSKTWSRISDSINKIGYADGVADGQASTFQSSFDMGYKIGMCLGIHLGGEEAIKSIHDHNQTIVHDSLRSNCCICSSTAIQEDNVFNLYNTQKEKNDSLEVIDNMSLQRSV